MIYKNISTPETKAIPNFYINFKNRICQWFDAIEIQDPNLAHLLCKTIPARCPFAREIKLFNRTLFQIPPLCKLNPLYEQIVALRFKALCYLADNCGEDIAIYC